MTLLVHGLFAALSDDDLYQGDRSANVVAMIKQWNVLSDWCIGYLNAGANSTDDTVQLARVRRMLAIGKRCLELSNFDSVFAIGLALDQARIAKTVRDAAGKASQEVWDNLVHITNFSRGFANYRALLDSLAPPAIPYLAIFMKDVVLIRENDSFIENTEFLNYRKLVILGSRLRFARRFQRVSYDFLAPLESVQAALRAPKQYAKLVRGSTNPAAAVAAAASTLNISRMSQDLNSTGGGSGAGGGGGGGGAGSAPLDSSRTITGKLQQLRTQFFTPRDSSPALSARESRDKPVVTKEKGALSARARKSGAPFTQSESSGDSGSVSPPVLADESGGVADNAPASPTSERRQRTAAGGWSRAAPKDGTAQPSSSLTLRRGSLLQNQSPMAQSPVSPTSQSQMQHREDRKSEGIDGGDEDAANKAQRANSETDMPEAQLSGAVPDTDDAGAGTSPSCSDDLEDEV